MSHLRIEALFSAESLIARAEFFAGAISQPRTLRAPGNGASADKDTRFGRILARKQHEWQLRAVGNADQQGQIMWSRGTEMGAGNKPHTYKLIQVESGRKLKYTTFQ